MDDGDLVLLEQELDAAHVLVDDRILARGQRAVVEAHAIGPGQPELDTLLRHAMEQVSRLQQRLGRDAAAVQAGAAELVSLDEAHVHAELRGANGAHVAHPATQDQQVEGLRLAHADCGRARSRPSYSVKVLRHSCGTGIGLDSA